MADLLGSRRRRVRSGIWALSGRVRMIGRPQSLTPRPGLGASSSASGWTGRPAERMPMSADALSDVLRTVRLTGATFFDVVATAPWVAEQPPRENDPAEDPARRRASDRLSRGHRRPLLRQPHRRRADRDRSRRSHRLHQGRSACPVEQSGHARRSRRTERP